MDFKNLNDISKLKRFGITCIELIFKFLNFSLILTFRCIKPSESFVFEILFIGDYTG